ncbi:hypothetical protein J6590_091944 [Homalodisca vitripennis]|nr:hypothetical protein J6590_091944 [Homalodisca vitripennis]
MRKHLIEIRCLILDFRTTRMDKRSGKGHLLSNRGLYMSFLSPLNMERPDLFQPLPAKAGKATFSGHSRL